VYEKFVRISCFRLIFIPITYYMLQIQMLQILCENTILNIFYEYLTRTSHDIFVTYTKNLKNYTVIALVHKAFCMVSAI
jgi:hypothetical protein